MYGIRDPDRYMHLPLVRLSTQKNVLTCEAKMRMKKKIVNVVKYGSSESEKACNRKKYVERYALRRRIRREGEVKGRGISTEEIWVVACACANLTLLG